MSDNIPIHGSMTRPGNPDVGVAEMIASRVPWTGGDLTVAAVTSEFTAVCPTTGQPDFYRVTITYKPRAWYVESKALKFYLWAFRNHGAHAETLAKAIAEHIARAVEPASVVVELAQAPRGGIGLNVRYEHTAPAA